MVAMGYKQYAIAGFSIQSLQKLLSFFYNFLKITILARLLKPTDFGLFSLVMIAIGLTESFTKQALTLLSFHPKKILIIFLIRPW
jgi:O-antigen/teichoic acid export membrane protein